MKKKNLDYLKYQLLNGNHEVLFEGMASECLEFYKKPENKNRIFWARKLGDTMCIKIDSFIYLCTLVDRFMPKSKKKCQSNDRALT